MPATGAKVEAIHLYRHRTDHAIGGLKLPFAEFWAILIELRPLSILLEVLLNFLFFMANVEVGFFIRCVKLFSFLQLLPFQR